MSNVTPTNVRVALIGGGNHGLQSILGAVGAVDGWRVTMIVEPDERARQRATTLLPDAAVYAQLDAIAEHQSDGGVQLAVLATPPTVTAQVLSDVLGHPAFARSALLVEKPGACHHEALIPSVAVAAGRQCVVQVAYSYRHHASVRAFSHALRAHGTLEKLELSFRAPHEVAGWRARRADGGGALRDLGSHLLDLARVLVPAEWTLHEADFRSHRTEDDDVRLQYTAGDRAIDVHAAYTGTPAFTVTAHTATGTLSCDLWRRTTPSASRVGGAWSRVRTALSPAYRPATLLRRAYADTLRQAVTSDAAPHVAPPALSAATLDDAIAVLQRIEHAERFRH